MGPTKQVSTVYSPKYVHRVNLSKLIEFQFVYLTSYKNINIHIYNMNIWLNLIRCLKMKVLKISTAVSYFHLFQSIRVKLNNNTSSWFFEGSPPTNPISGIVLGSRRWTYEINPSMTFWWFQFHGGLLELKNLMDIKDFSKELHPEKITWN